MKLPLGTSALRLEPPRGVEIDALMPTADGALDRLAPLARVIEDVSRRVPLAGVSRALVLVPDRTRAFPLSESLPPLLAGLLARGLPAPAITVFLASGTHAAAPADDAPARLGPLPAGVRVTRNDPDGEHALAGTTRAGTPVRVAPALVESDLVLALGGTAFHYFAGFGGGGKMLFPGAGARASIAANHARSLGPWPPGGLAPGVGPGRLRGNPVADDLAAAFDLLPRAEHVTALRDATGAWRAQAWRERAEFEALCATYASGRRVGEPGAYDLVCAAAGGAPRDLDVIQAHKALFHAALYAADGAELVLAAACDEGAGSTPFARWLESPDRPALEAGARARYDLNAQTAVSLTAIAARLRVTWIATRRLPALARWGVRVVEAREGERALAEALARARGRRVAWLESAADVLPAAPSSPASPAAPAPPAGA